MDGNLVKLMLRDVLSIINESEIMRQEKGDYFNLLEISGISTTEVKMCRILAEIINPRGSHCQNILFLKSFITEVLKIEVVDDELERTSVMTEYVTDNGRRIDIAIITPKRFIPIEVKLYAKDQKSQCLDYYNYAKSKGGIISKVYYLTIDGHLPNEDEGLTPIKLEGKIMGYEEVISLSFIHDVCRWLNGVSQGVADKPMLYMNLLQFEKTLKKLGGNMDTELNKKIAGLISTNCDNFKTALLISESINVAKENLLLKMFGMIEIRMNSLEYPLEQLNNQFDYKYNNYYAIYNYYYKKTLPALVYKYKRIDDSKEIWFIIELGAFGGLYCGFVVAENGENPKKLVLSDDEIKKHFKNSFIMDKEDWWFFWRYLPYHLGKYMPETNPDFKACNETYLTLFNDGGIESLVDNIIFRIDILLHSMIGLTMIEQCKRNNMPKQNATFILERAFIQEEINLLKKGHIAKEMEDKWCGYFKDGKLYIHSSWTKKCIYIITFNNETNSHKVVVNRSEKQYLCKSIDDDVRLVNYILNYWLNLN